MVGTVAVTAIVGFLVNAAVCLVLARRPWPPGAPITFSLPQPVPGDPTGAWQVTAKRALGRGLMNFSCRRETEFAFSSMQVSAVQAGHSADPSAVLPRWSSEPRAGLLDSIPLDADGRPPIVFIREERAYGWPFLAARSMTYAAWDGETWSNGVLSGLAITEPEPGMGFARDVLPVRPLFLATTLNSGLYGGTLLLAWLVVAGILHRWWRRRRGRCPHCGYDLRGSRDLCPECGHSTAQATN
jgi:hypothetical protein